MERAARRGPRGRPPRPRGRRGAGHRAAVRSAPRSSIPTCSRRCAAWASSACTPTRREALHAAWAGPHDRHHRHRLGQVAVLQPARRSTCSAATPRARALPVPDEGARPGPGAGAERVRAAPAGAPRDLRRRHAARGARADPPRARTSCSRNPDMLHVGILPNHAAWAELFANLAVVVIDEAHVYRGVFGSHVANVLRRLRRIAAAYGTEPRFLLASATIANPVGAGRAADGPRGRAADRRRRRARAPRRRIAMWNPPADRRGARHAPLGARRRRRSCWPSSCAAGRGRSAS